jgi:hypothetical protein
MATGNARDYQNAGKLPPGGWLAAGDCWRYRPGVAPGDLGKLPPRESWPDHTGERQPERQRLPERRGLLALSSRRDRMARGMRQPENWPPWGVGRIIKANASRGTLRLPERRELLALLSRRDRVALGKLPPGDCWRYCPGVTAWPWGSCRPGDCWRYRPGVAA